VIETPCVIADNAHIGEDAHIGPFTVIGPGCTVGRNASAKRSILWQNASLQTGAHARNCVIGTSGCLLENAQAYEGAVLGTGAVLGERSVLLPGVKLWPGKHTGPGERISCNLVWGGNHRLSFSGGSIPLSAPAQVMQATQAYCAAFAPDRLLLGRTDMPVANVMWHAAAAGAMAQGVQVLDLGVCNLPILRHAMNALGCDGGMLVSDGRFTPLQSDGALLLGRQQRTLIQLFSRQDFSRPFSSAPLPILQSGMPTLSYSAALIRRFDAVPSASPDILLYCADEWQSDIAATVIGRIGLNVRRLPYNDRRIPGPHELGVHLDANGEAFRLSDMNGPLTEALHQMFIAWTALVAGENHLLMHVSDTRTIRTLAHAHGASVEYTGGEPLAWQDALARRFPEQFALHFDGLYGAIAGIAALVRQNMTLSQWRSGMPGTCRQRRIIDIPGADIGHILGSLAGSMPDARPDCGIRFRSGSGWAWICPGDDLNSFRIVAESAKAETARELCDFCENEIRRIGKK